MEGSQSPGDAREASVADLTRRAVDSKPAPAPLDLVQQLVNTRNLLVGYDLLDDRDSARTWLALRTGEVAAALDEQDLVRLRSLREGLRGLLLAHTVDTTPPPDVVARLRETARGATLRVDVDDSGAPVLAAAADLDVVAGLESRVFAALTAAPPDIRRRLKACLNPDCTWAFYDASRSRSGSWCVMGICGARHKMVAYRRRQAKGNDATNSQGPPT